MAGRRVLITGVANPFGARLARRLAADDDVSLSRALREAGRTALPIAAPLWGPVVGAARGVLGQPALPDEIGRYLRFGRGVDTTRMRRELRFGPRHSTLEALARAAGPVAAA